MSQSMYKSRQTKSCFTITTGSDKGSDKAGIGVHRQERGILQVQVSGQDAFLHWMQTR
jgi:hypothetical protein